MMARLFYHFLFFASFMAAGNVIAAPFTVVDGIDLDGIKRTEEITVLRELPFKIGSFWQKHYSTDAERRLRNLGIFSEVTVSAPDKDGTVHIRVKERWTLWVLPQGARADNGASSASIVVDEYNLWGLNHHARLAYKRETGKNFSALKGTSYEAAYDWLRVANSKLSMSISGSWGRSLLDVYENGLQSAQYMKTGRATALYFSYALDEVPNEGWSVSTGFSGSNAEYRFISGIPQNDIVGERVRSVLMGFNYSRVNDHITWLTGKSLAYSLSVAHRALGSTINTYSHLASWRKYYTLSGQKTFNLRLNGGLMTGDVMRSGTFDIGNRNSLRGYYPGELQGTHYLYGTFEGRFPIRKDSNFQLVTFTDLGKIGGKVGTSVTRNLAIGAGGGFRWTLRWLTRGTIRGDVAYGVASKRWRFYLGTGQAF